MKDLFGNKKPVQIDTDEWWFNGRIIQKQFNPLLSPFVSFSDDEKNYFVSIHFTKKETIDFCLKNPCLTPKNTPKDYL